MTDDGFKQKIYTQFARIGQAMASERRLELLDLLAQGPRHVEALSELTGLPVANVSQHLKVLKGAGLVETERDGTKVVHRITGPEVLRLWLTLASVAEQRLAEVQQIVRWLGPPSDDGSMISRDLVETMLATGKVLLLDVRPRHEFEHGHLPGAVSVPLDELHANVDALPRDRPIVTYCRGTYCLMADEAAALLRDKGFDARRIEGGWPEWVCEDRPV